MYVFLIGLFISMDLFNLSTVHFDFGSQNSLKHVKKKRHQNDPPTPPNPQHPNRMLMPSSDLSEGVKNTQMNLPYHTESVSQHVDHFKPIFFFFF